MDKLNGKPIWFPTVTRFSDLFTELDLPKQWPMGTSTRITSFMQISGHETPHFSTQVEPNEAVLAAVKATMLAVERDNISFAAVVWEPVNGKPAKALIVARYSQILGSHYVALVDADTVPMRPARDLVREA